VVKGGSGLSKIPGGGRDVLELALRRLKDVYQITPLKRIRALHEKKKREEENKILKGEGKEPVCMCSRRKNQKLNLMSMKEFRLSGKKEGIFGKERKRPQRPCEGQMEREV